MVSLTHDVAVKVQDDHLGLKEETAGLALMEEEDAVDLVLTEGAILNLTNITAVQEMCASITFHSSMSS